MSYRPQFPYFPAGEGCDDQRCHYSFDGSNTPALVSVAAGAVLSKIPLLMDQDAPFFWRALQVSATGLLIRIEDCNGNPLLPSDAVLDSSFWCETGGAGLVPLESDIWGIFCPAGGGLFLYVSNLTAGAITDLVITLHGVKRYSEANCS